MQCTTVTLVLCRAVLFCPNVPPDAPLATCTPDCGCGSYLDCNNTAADGSDANYQCGMLFRVYGLRTGSAAGPKRELAFQSVLLQTYIPGAGTGRGRQGCYDTGGLCKW